MEDLLNLFDTFQGKWSIKRMQKLSLEEYTNLNRDSFTYNFPLNYIQKQLGYSSIDKLTELYENILPMPDKLKIKKFNILN